MKCNRCTPASFQRHCFAETYFISLRAYTRVSTWITLSGVILGSLIAFFLTLVSDSWDSDILILKIFEIGGKVHWIFFKSIGARKFLTMLCLKIIQSFMNIIYMIFRNSLIILNCTITT